MKESRFKARHESLSNTQWLAWGFQSFTSTSAVSYKAKSIIHAPGFALRQKLKSLKKNSGFAIVGLLIGQIFLNVIVAQREQVTPNDLLNTS